MPTIDGQRVLADLRRLAEFGRYKTGVHRPTYSPRRRVAALAGRSCARRGSIRSSTASATSSAAPRRQRRLLVGSHLETQPYGGWLDGALGVIYGLELARAFAADPDCAGLGIEVAAWADEEGHYGSYLGSRRLSAPSARPRSTGGTRRRHPAAYGAAAAGVADRSARAGRFRPLCRLSRSPYRAGRHARQRLAHRRRRGDRRHLELVGHLYRRAEPCRHDADVRRRDAGVAMVRLDGRGSAIGFPKSPAHARCGRSGACRSIRTRRAIAGAGRDAGPVPRRRHRLLGRLNKALFELVDKPTRGPCRVQSRRLSRSQPGGDGCRLSVWAIEAAAERHAPGLHLTHAERRRS